MVIHSDRRPTSKHVRRYNGFQAFEAAVFDHTAEKKVVGRQDIVILQRGELTNAEF